MEEMIKKINDLLVCFNDLFELKPMIEEIDGEQVATGFTINKLSNDGRKFVDEFYDIFGQLINSTQEYELVYDEQQGFVIAKTVIKQTKAFEKAF